MFADSKNLLWKWSAGFIGASMPLILLGRAVFAIVLVLGLILGLIATKGASLRETAKLFYTAETPKRIALFLGAALLSVPFAIHQMDALRNWSELLALTAGGTALYLVLREMPTRHTDHAMRALGISLCLMVILALLDMFLQDYRLSHALHGKKWDSPYRLNFMSSVFAVLLPFLWAWLLKTWREGFPLARTLALPLAVTSIVAVFVCGGRSGWIALLLSGGLFLWMASKRHGFVLHRWHWVLGIAILILGPLAYGFTQGWEFFAERLGTTGDATIDSTSGGRIGIWAFAIQHLMDNPFTGIGVDGFRYLPNPPLGIASIAHPHNIVLQLLLEVGLIGTAAAVYALTHILKTFWRFAQDNLYGLAGFCAIVAFLTSSLASMSVFQPWWLSFLMFSGIFAARIGWSEKPFRMKRDQTNHTWSATKK